MSKELEYNRSLANGPIDRKLLRAASDGMGPNELSRAVGGIIPPEQAAQRVRDLLESRNWLTFFEKEQLIQEEINEILSSLRVWIDAGSVQHINAALKGLSMKQTALYKNQLDPEALSNMVREGQARIMLMAIQAAMMGAVDELQKRYPAIDEAELREVFMLALPGAVDAVESRIEQQ